MYTTPLHILFHYIITEKDLCVYSCLIVTQIYMLSIFVAVPDRNRIFFLPWSNSVCVANQSLGTSSTQCANIHCLYEFLRPQKWINLGALHRLHTQYCKHMIKTQWFVILLVCWLQTRFKCQQWVGFSI